MNDRKFPTPEEHRTEEVIRAQQMKAKYDSKTQKYTIFVCEDGTDETLSVGSYITDIQVYWLAMLVLFFKVWYLELIYISIPARNMYYRYELKDYLRSVWHMGYRLFTVRYVTEYQKELEEANEDFYTIDYELEEEIGYKFNVRPDTTSPIFVDLYYSGLINAIRQYKGEPK